MFGASPKIQCIASQDDYIPPFTEMSMPVDIPKSRPKVVLGHEHEDVVSIATGLQMLGLSPTEEMKT